MPRQAIRQATCTECGESDENHTVTDTDIEIGEESITFDVRCTCGAEGSVVLDDAGVAGVENLSHEDASWNEENEEDD